MEEMDSVNLIQYGKIHYYENVITDPDYLINLIELSDGGLKHQYPCVERMGGKRRYRVCIWLSKKI
jgi:hypothetical protein